MTGPRVGSLEGNVRTLAAMRLVVPSMVRTMGLLVGTLEVYEFVDKRCQKGQVSEAVYRECVQHFKDRVPKRDEIENALQVFDEGKSGFVDTQGLLNIVKQMGDMVAEKELRDLLFKMKNKESKVKMQELVDLLMN